VAARRRDQGDCAARVPTVPVRRLFRRVICPLLLGRGEKQALKVIANIGF
jgi:hypothetical protein